MAIISAVGVRGHYLRPAFMCLSSDCRLTIMQKDRRFFCVEKKRADSQHEELICLLTMVVSLSEGCLHV